jgi:hypothetical protein
VARCGRCGLWNNYPEGHPETKFAGVCVWYQLRLPSHEVYEYRECPDFFEAIPGMSALEHFQYKIQRENLRDAYIIAKRSKVLAYIALAASLFSVLFNAFTFLWEDLWMR